MKRSSPLRIDGVGKAYAAKIEIWQKDATFADETEWVGEMIVSDARRILELIRQIHALDAKIEATAASSVIATRLRTIKASGRSAQRHWPRRSATSITSRRKRAWLCMSG